MAAAVDHFTAAADVGTGSSGRPAATTMPRVCTTRCVEHGFEPEEPESIMIGEARLLAVDVPLPDGVTLRRITEEHDVRAMAAMQDEVFGDLDSDHAEGMLRRLARDDRSRAVGRRGARAGSSAPAGWSRCPAPTSPVSGAARPGASGAAGASTARSPRPAPALRSTSGCTLVNSDSTEYSRPILERVGAHQGLHHHALPLEEVTRHEHPTEPRVRPGARPDG